VAHEDSHRDRDLPSLAAVSQWCSVDGIYGLEKGVALPHCQRARHTQEAHRDPRDPPKAHRDARRGSRRPRFLPPLASRRAKNRHSHSKTKCGRSEPFRAGAERLRRSGQAGSSGRAWGPRRGRRAASPLGGNPTPLFNNSTPLNLYKISVSGFQNYFLRGLTCHFCPSTPL
jgi:hypothetical protein